MFTDDVIVHSEILHSPYCTDLLWNISVSNDIALSQVLETLLPSTVAS